MQQQYVLSIPILFAQTDGICKELFNQYFFMKHDKRPRTAHYVEEFSDDAHAVAMMAALAYTLPINESEVERQRHPSKLNRHAVLHGEALDYGSQMNAYKAISLIHYIVSIFFNVERTRKSRGVN